MARLGIIAGSGAGFFPQLAGAESGPVTNSWGPVVGGIARWSQSGHEIFLISRHGPAANIPPHRVNYRANVQAFSDLGVDWIVALNAVGGISPLMLPGKLVLPHQLIDYTWGREHTFYSDISQDSHLEFIDYTNPYSDLLRKNLISSSMHSGLDILTQAVYGATQGPRLETAAEIDRLERDGCDIVGMTGMPEAALARERGLHYASCSLVVNWAAGRSATGIHTEMDTFLRAGMLQAAALLKALLQVL